MVKDPKNVNPFADTDNTAPRDTPPLTLMSISVRTVINHALNKREIVTASLRIWENSALLSPNAESLTDASPYT